jgi:hypothetical protein
MQHIPPLLHLTLLLPLPPLLLLLLLLLLQVMLGDQQAPAVAARHCLAQPPSPMRWPHLVWQVAQQPAAWPQQQQHWRLCRRQQQPPRPLPQS